jgi:hypothetical protein
VSFSAAVTARAGELLSQPAPFESKKSRSDVKEELRRYKQAGVNPWSTSYTPLRSFKSTRTRADVQAEFLASREEVAAFNGEDSGSAFLASRRPAPRTTVAPLLGRRAD